MERHFLRWQRSQILPLLIRHQYKQETLTRAVFLQTRFFFFAVLCPEDWYFFDGMCWYFSGGDQKAPWQSAQDMCQEGSSYANLLSIHNQGDNDFVQRVSNTNPWIGLQIDSADNFHWVDNSVVDYTNWKKNEPNNVDTEKCTALNHNNGNWTSEDCQKQKSFICRFKNSEFSLLHTSNFV